MIIASALKRLFDGVEIDLIIDNEPIKRGLQFHYGDHKELTKWIAGRTKKQKYPLLWYVVEPYFDEPNELKRVKTQFIIFQSTKTEWYNTDRSIKSYDAIIEPTWQVVKKTLEQNPFINVIGKLTTKYKIKDEPSYGVNASSNTDFTNKQKKGDQSITLDIVDGRIIELELRIKTNCI